MDINRLKSKLRLSGLHIKELDIQTVITLSNEGQRLYRIDDNGKIIKSILYSSIKPDLNLGLAIIEENGRFGLISLNCVVLVKPIYESVRIIDNNLIVLQDSDTVSIFNGKLEQLTPGIYKSIKFIFKIDNEYLVGFKSLENANIYYKINRSSAVRVKFEFEIYNIYSTIEYIIGVDIKTGKFKAYNIKNKETYEIQGKPIRKYNIVTFETIEKSKPIQHKSKIIKNYYRGEQ